MMDKLKSADYYDKKYAVGGYKQEYFKSFKDSMYKECWESLLSFLQITPHSQIVEIGCGSGILAEEILRKNPHSYLGIDFSQVAINQCVERCMNSPHPRFRFIAADAYASSCYYYASDIVATEVLEHVRSDTELVSLIPSGVRVHFSLPNFPGGSHVRTYGSKRAIIERFKGLVDFSKIVTRQRTMDVGTGRKIFVATGVRL